MSKQTSGHLPMANTTLAILVVASFLVAFLPVWQSLWSAWSGSEDYSHGFLILPLSMLLLWRKRDALRDVAVRPAESGLFLSLFSLLIYLFSRVAEVQTLASLSMVLFLSGSVLYLFGPAVFREALFPLTLLLFMIPVPAQIYAALTVPLQLLVSGAAVGLAGILGIPVLQEGNVLQLPQRALEVVQACSGLRSMVSLLLLSLLFGYFTLRSNLLRTVLFLFGIPLAIVTNILRVLAMMISFYYFDLDLTQGAAHTLLGLGTFAVALTFLAVAKGALARWDTSTETA